jgi:cell division protein FtsB
MDFSFWDDQLKKFREMKRKSAPVTELLAVAEDVLIKLRNLKQEKDTEIAKLTAENQSLKQTNNDLMNELDKAWE